MTRALSGGAFFAPQTKGNHMVRKCLQHSSLNENLLCVFHRRSFFIRLVHFPDGSFPDDQENELT